jgi:hypothetical protein
MAFVMDENLVRELFDYDGKRGVLVWKQRSLEHFVSVRAWKARNARYAGKDAGHQDGDGYTYIVTNGRRWLAHRLIWLFVTGELPNEQIDHVDGHRSNNRFENLREVTLSQNSRNRKQPVNNSSGRIGVVWDGSRRKWLSQIRFSGRLRHLGRYSRFEDACAARAQGECQFGFHPNHGRKSV